MEAPQLVAWKQPPDVRDVPVPEPGQREIGAAGGGLGLDGGMAPLARLGHLRAHVARYPLADAARAYEAFAAGRTSGRAVIVPEP